MSLQSLMQQSKAHSSIRVKFYKCCALAVAAATPGEAAAAEAQARKLMESYTIDPTTLPKTYIASNELLQTLCKEFLDKKLYNKPKEGNRVTKAHKLAPLPELPLTPCIFTVPEPSKLKGRNKDGNNRKIYTRTKQYTKFWSEKEVQQLIVYLNAHVPRKEIAHEMGLLESEIGSKIAGLKDKLKQEGKWIYNFKEQMW